MNTLDAKREQLFKAAEDFIFNGKTVDLQRKLCDCASAYHLARAETFKANYKAKGETNGNGAKYVIPFGRTQGTPIGEASKADLEWILPKLKGSLDDPDKARYREKNQKLVDAIEAELESR